MSYEEVLLLHRVGGGVKMEALAAVVRRMFVKYWIYICGTMFFFVSFEGKIVLYKVIYMVMFLCCVALYQVGPALLRTCTAVVSCLWTNQQQTPEFYEYSGTSTYEFHLFQSRFVT